MTKKNTDFTDLVLKKKITKQKTLRRGENNRISRVATLYYLRCLLFNNNNNNKKGDMQRNKKKYVPSTGDEAVDKHCS